MDVKKKIRLLYTAIKQYDYITVRRLLAKNTELVEWLRSSGHEAMIIASIWGKQEVVAELILRGADVCGRDGFGRTPLGVATAHGNHSIVNILLAHGAIV